MPENAVEFALVAEGKITAPQCVPSVDFCTTTVPTKEPVRVSTVTLNGIGLDVTAGVELGAICGVNDDEMPVAAVV